jgi:hypothetical protein
MRFGSLLVLIAVAGCSGGKDDVDGDGFGPDVDCDDNDPDVNPDASELCDEIDNNCNGEVDEFALIELYGDGDGDGFGSGTPELVCADTPGYVRDGGDCDDDDAGINPDATELCDPVDRNCDGDAYLGATDFTTWYFDNDRDGYGIDDNPLTTVCAPPAGYSDQGGDCDDADDDINPAATEVCNNEDDDCNGTTDDNASDAVMAYDDADGDTYGDPATGSVRCAAPGTVLNGDDCNDTTRNVRPGVPDTCNGVDDDCDPATDEDLVDGDTWYYDTDGDGAGDDLNPVRACTQPAGTTPIGGDCDDNDPGTLGGVDWYDDNDLDGFGDPDTAVIACTQPPGLIAVGNDCNDASDVSYPFAPELCDGLDNDCDLAIDDNAVNGTSYFVDADGDLFGDPAQSVLACTQPPGTSLAGTDCDDTAATTYPGANDICDGGVDNDCDPGTDEAFTAVNYRDADNDGYGTDADTVFGCSPPPGYVQVSGDCDDTDDSVNPVDTPDCTRNHCGTVSLSETWGPPLRHRVTCDVLVQGAARPTLTIQAGTRVEFASGTELSVASASDGRLVVNGQAGVPAVFTSDDTVKAPGQWSGVWINARDTGSSITHLVVEAAGQNAPPSSQPGGVVLTGADVVIDDLTSSTNLGAGLVINTGAEPLVVRSTFTGNTGNGVYGGVGSGLSRLDESGTQGPSFQDNVVSGNGLRPITIPGSHADEIDLSNTLSPNATEEIELLSGILRFTGTWYDHGLPYVVAANALIEVEDGPAAELTIDDNVSVYFGQGAELTIGVDAGGSLFTGANNVFTGTADVIANSLNWDGLRIGTNDLGSVIADLDISYGGANTRGNIWVDDSAPMIERVFSHDSDNAGIYVSGAGAAPWIRDSDITDNDTNGVFVESSSGVARDSGGPTFSGNLLTRNGQSSVVFPPNFIGELDPSTTFVGNGDRVGIHGGTVLDDALWRKLDEDYEVRGDVFIGGPRDPVVDIEDEVTVYFDRDTSLRAGTVDDGVLRVNGSLANGVLFTSSDPAPGQGDWEGVMFGGAVTPDAQIADHLLANLTIRYAGGSDVLPGGAIEFDDRSFCGPTQNLFLNNVTIEQTTKAAYYQHVTATVYIDGFVTDSSPDMAFNFDPTPPICGFTIRSAADQTAKGIDIPSTLALGVFPVYELVDLQDPSNVFSTSPVVRDSTITSNTVIPDLGVPVIVENDIALGGAASPSLLIDPNVELRFEPGAGITCGQSGPGLLIADGVTMTSNAAIPNIGDWRGITLNISCATVMQDTLIEYAGGNGFGAIYNPSSLCCGQNPAVDLFTGGGSVLYQMTIKDSSTCGMYGVDDPDANRDGLLDASGLAWPPYFAPNGSIPEFESNFTGFIGGLGAHCP